MALDNELIHGTEFLFNFFWGGWSSYSFLQHASPVDQLWDTLQGFHWGWKGQPLQPNLMCVCLGCLYNSSVKIGIWWIWCCWFSVCWLNPHFLLVKFPFAVSWIPVCGFFAHISCWSPQVTPGQPGSPPAFWFIIRSNHCMVLSTHTHEYLREVGSYSKTHPFVTVDCHTLSLRISHQGSW